MGNGANKYSRTGIYSYANSVFDSAVNVAGLLIWLSLQISAVLTGIKVQIEIAGKVFNSAKLTMLSDISISTFFSFVKSLIQLMLFPNG